MLTFQTDIDNLRARLHGIGLGPEHRDGEKAADAIIAVLLTLSTFEMDDDTKTTVLNLISSHGLRSIKSTPFFVEEDWKDFDYGNVKIGDFVRVKKDAYDSVTGAKHNGLVGVLKFMKSGQCSVDYIGLASGNTMKHPKERLESLKRSVQ